MDNQIFTACQYCGQVGSDKHHLQKRSTHPELKDNPENIIILCRTCHVRSETDNDFLNGLQEIFSFNPKSLEIFTRAMKTIEALENGTLTDYTTPAMVDAYLQLATAKYAYVSEQLGQLEIGQAEYFTMNSDEEKTNKELEMLWKTTENGRRQVELSRKLKVLAALMSTFKAKMRRFETERWNLK